MILATEAVVVVVTGKRSMASLRGGGDGVRSAGSEVSLGSQPF